MGVPPLPGRDAARRVAVPDGGPRGCRKVRKNLDGTLAGSRKSDLRGSSFKVAMGSGVANPGALQEWSI